MGMAEGGPSERVRPERTSRSQSSGQSSRPSGNTVAPNRRSIRHLLKQAACSSPSSPRAQGASGHAAWDAASMKRAEVGFAIGSPHALIKRHWCRGRNGTGEGNGIGDELARPDARSLPGAHQTQWGEGPSRARRQFSPGSSWSQSAAPSFGGRNNGSFGFMFGR